MNPTLQTNVGWDIKPIGSLIKLYSSSSELASIHIDNDNNIYTRFYYTVSNNQFLFIPIIKQQSIFNQVFNQISIQKVLLPSSHMKNKREQ